MRHSFSRSLPPKFFARVFVQTEDYKFVKRIWVLDSKNAFRLVFRLGRRRIDSTCVDCRQQKHFVVPNNGRGISLTLDRDFPSDILAFTPLNWRIRIATNAVGIRASPLMPICFLRFDRAIVRCTYTQLKANEENRNRGEVRFAPSWSHHFQAQAKGQKQLYNLVAFFFFGRRIPIIAI